MAMVVGKMAKDVSAENWSDYIFGYLNFIDGSARGLQPGQGNTFYQMKARDTYCPMGPFIVTADEIPDPQNLQIRLWVNEKLTQNYNTNDMGHQIPRVSWSGSSSMPDPRARRRHRHRHQPPRPQCFPRWRQDRDGGRRPRQAPLQRAGRPQTHLEPRHSLWTCRTRGPTAPHPSSPASTPARPMPAGCGLSASFANMP